MSNTIPAPTDRTCEPDGSPTRSGSMPQPSWRVGSRHSPTRCACVCCQRSSPDPRGEACVCDLAELGDVSQPTISHHLKVLKDTGLLTSERRSTWVYYRLQPTQEAAVTSIARVVRARGSARRRGAWRSTECSHTPAEPVENVDERVTHLADELAAGTRRD